MYTILNNTRVNIIEETFDDITLTLYIKPNLKMSTVYELFESTDLHTITIYNDDDTLYGTRSEYINVGNFTFDKFSNWYIINLIRDKIDNLKVRMVSKNRIYRIFLESNFKISWNSRNRNMFYYNPTERIIIRINNIFSDTYSSSSWRCIKIKKNEHGKC